MTKGLFAILAWLLDMFPSMYRHRAIKRQIRKSIMPVRLILIFIIGFFLPLQLTTGASANDGVFDDRIIFGQSAALEGPAASLGQGVRDGILAAFREVNENGGVFSRRLELISLNDGYEPERSIDNTQKLIFDDDVFALVGEVGTPTSRAAQPIAEENSIPFIGAFTGAQFLREPSLETVVNIRASYNQEAEKLIEHLVDNLGHRKIAILYQDDTFGQSGLAGIVAALDRRNLQPVADATYMRNTTAVKRGLLSIRRQKPDAVVIVGAYKPAAEFIRTADQIDLDAIFAAFSFVGSTALAQELGPTDEQVLISQVVPPIAEDGPALVRRFVSALSLTAPDAEPSFVALEGYVTGRFIAEVLKKLGPDPTREAFLEVFEEDVSFELDGIVLEFGPEDNQGSDKVYLTFIQPDGTLAPVDSQADLSSGQEQ